MYRQWLLRLGNRGDMGCEPEPVEDEDYMEDEWGSEGGSDEYDSEEEIEGWESEEGSDDEISDDDWADNSMDIERESKDGSTEDLFSPILAQIRFDIVPKFIVSVRQYYDKVDRGEWVEEPLSEEHDEKPENSYEVRCSNEDEQSAEPISKISATEELEDNKGSRGNTVKPETINSVLVGQPIFGDLHVVLPLAFPDGVEWALKIPANGTPELFDEASQMALRTEAMTMDLLKRYTTIPLPRVFGFEKDCENELECPFIIMEFVRGQPLSEFWYRKTSPEDLRAYRASILREISKAMTQLNKFSFDEGGFPKFRNDGELQGEVGPLRLVMHRESNDTEPPNKVSMPTFVKSDPFEDPKRFFIAMVKLHRKPSTKFGKGVLKLFRMFLSEIPDPADKLSFVLAHPKLDLENIIVSECGEIQGFIGWTNVCSVPRCIGNETYPWWLLDNYIDTPGEDSCKDNGAENSPSLSYYRGLYDRYMTPTFSQKRDFNLTRNSHIYLGLYAAALHPRDTIDFLSNIFHEMTKSSRPPLGDIGFEDVCNALHGGYLSGYQDGCLETAIEQLLEPPRCCFYRTNGLKKWIDRDWP